MSLSRTIALSRAPLAGFVAIGLFWGSFAAMLPQLKARLGAGDAEMGVLLLVSALGALIAMALAPRIDGWAPRAALPVSGLLLAVAVAPLGTAASIAAFAAAIIAVGVTTGLLDILANARVSQVEARHDLSLMNFNHACYSFAYAAAALATGAARENGIAEPLWFLLVAAVILGCALLILRAAGPGTAAGEAVDTRKGPAGAFAWTAGVVVLIAFFVENATEGWSALHIERTLQGGAAEGALGPAMLGLTMGVGRLAGHFVTVRGTEMTVIRWAALLSASGLALAAAAPVPLLAYLGFGLLGLGVSVIAPLGLAMAGQAAPPGRRTLAISRAAMVGYFGFFIGPPLMGLLSEAFGLRAAFGIAALMLLLIPLALLPRLRVLDPS